MNNDLPQQYQGWTIQGGWECVGDVFVAYATMNHGGGKWGNGIGGFDVHDDVVLSQPGALVLARKAAHHDGYEKLEVLKTSLNL